MVRSLKKPRVKSVSEQKTAIIANKVVKKVLRKQVETKYHDIFGNLNVLSSTYAIQLINGLSQGAGDFTRVGNEVYNTTLYAKIGVSFPDSTNYVRIMIVWDRQPNGLLPVAADLLTYPASPVYSFLNPDSKARFRVMYDKLLCGGTNSPGAITINKKFKLCKSTLYKGITDTIASVNSGALYLITMNDSGVAPNPQVDYMFRMCYRDI